MSTSKSHTREPLNTRQRSILIGFYNKNPYPSASERQQLVQVTGRTSKQIQDWFSNRRRNDPNLIATKTTMNTKTVACPPTQPIYYYTPASFGSQPLPPNTCSCCCFVQADCSIDQSYYANCSSYYYSQSNSYYP